MNNQSVPKIEARAENVNPVTAMGSSSMKSCSNRNNLTIALHIHYRHQHLGLVNPCNIAILTYLEVIPLILKLSQGCKCLNCIATSDLRESPAGKFIKLTRGLCYSELTELQYSKITTYIRTVSSCLLFS